MRLTATIFLTGLLLFQLGCAGSRPGPVQPVPPSQPPAGPAGSPGTETPSRAARPDSPFKSYESVITDKAVTDEGLFTTHRMDEKLFFEIADSLLGREILLVSRIAGITPDLTFGGAGMEARDQQVVRWERQYNNLLLRHVSYESVAADTLPIYQAVRSNNFEPVVASFRIEALGQDSASYVLDVTRLFTTDVPLIGALSNGQRQQFQVRRVDGERSFVSGAKSFPLNTEIQHVLTYDAGQPPADAVTGTLSLGMNQSFVLLPKVPMQPRLYDPRVGYYTVDQIDYGTEEHKAATRSYITRWRLEPKDPAAYARGELVEPVKPIVYYIDPATPVEWRPYLKQGVEDWQPAFEAAGFKHAIIAKDPPSPEEDPEFSVDDVRYSVIRYVANPIENAQGPHIHDPRSGEILESDILWYHNIMNLMRSLYFLQTAAHDPAARTAKFSEELTGALVRYVLAHEVGHTLGMPHNWGASHAYPVDSLRSATFTQQYGVSPSIMDYSRFNYVRQPGDVGVATMPTKVGPYDIHAVEWGYRLIPGANSPAAEKPTLNAWLRAKENDPMYFYGRQTGNTIDPRSQREDIGDDPVKASTYAVANLRRAAENMVSWTSVPGAYFDDLAHINNMLYWHWNLYMSHPAKLIGGVYETWRTADIGKPIYEPVPAARQREAMQFLHEYAFSNQDWLINADVATRLTHSGTVDQLRGLQASVLNILLEEGRISRLIEAEARFGDDTYTPREMLGDLRRGLWAELGRGEAIEVYRRNVQRAYIERMERFMTQEQPQVPPAFQFFVGFSPVDVSQSDIRPLVRGELTTLRSEIQRALPRTRDEMTRLHLTDAVARIDAILDPNR